MESLVTAAYTLVGYSDKGKSLVLFTPDITHASDCKKYNNNNGSKYFHEAGFDAFCVGFGKLWTHTQSNYLLVWSIFAYLRFHFND